MSNDDLELLRQYARRGSEEAFATLVNRHLNLVYSVALRVVRSPPLAEETAQSVFADLARNADNMKPDTILTAWLYRVTHHTAVDVVRRESRRQTRERKALEIAEVNGTTSEWTHIEPLLEEAMEALEEPDRVAILLRHFENKSLREVGETLGISEDAAQKRVSRAVDHLREFFSKRGVAVGSAGLVALLSAHAVQAAPAGLGVAISTATVLSATTLKGATTLGVTKAIAMTTTQKVLIAAATAGLAVTAGTSLYQTHHLSQVQQQLVALQQQQEPLALQVEQLRREREDAQKQNDQLRRDNADLPRLRGEVTRLQAGAQELATLKAADNEKTTGADTRKDADPMEKAAKALLTKIDLLKQRLEQMPEKNIPELQYLDPDIWAQIAQTANLDTDTGVRQALSSLRSIAKQIFAPEMGRSLQKYTQANNGQLPSDVSQLKPYFEPPADDATLARYQMIRTGNIRDLPPDEMIVAEKAAVDDEYDNLFQIGLNVRRSQGVGKKAGEINSGGWP